MGITNVKIRKNGKIGVAISTGVVTTLSADLKFLSGMYLTDEQMVQVRELLGKKA